MKFDEKILYHAILGTDGPSHRNIDHPIMKGSGNYVGGMLDRWVWDKSGLKKLGKNQLEAIYKLCENPYAPHENDMPEVGSVNLKDGPINHNGLHDVIKRGLE